MNQALTFLKYRVFKLSPLLDWNDILPIDGLGIFVKAISPSLDDDSLENSSNADTLISS